MPVLATRFPIYVIRVLLVLLALLSSCQSALDPQLPPRSDPPLLAAYKLGHYRAIPSPQGPALSWSRLLLELRGRRLLLLGDIHDDRGLHESMRRVLAALSVELDARSSAQPREVWLLVESLGSEEGDVLRPGAAPPTREGREAALASLRAHLHERWPESWMEREQLDGAFYRDLHRIAALGGWGFAGFEPIPRLPLPQRDARIAAEIEQRLRASPDSLVIVVVGHAHLLGPARLVERLAAFEPLTLLPRLAPDRRPLPGGSPFYQIRPGLWLLRPLR
jgi:hypothetical protein